MRPTDDNAGEMPDEMGNEPTPPEMSDAEAFEFYDDPANREPQGPPVRRGSAHPDQPPSAAQEIDADRLGSVLYAWMMDDPQRGWNIIGMALPTGQYMPMVTSSMEVAWQGFDWAQAHANRHNVRCELVVYERSTTIAIVDPEPGGDDG